jgi:hypothetical protein
VNYAHLSSQCKKAIATLESKIFDGKWSQDGHPLALLKG